MLSKTDDLVRLSGASRSTVFRFLRGDAVRPALRESILAAMRELNIHHEGHSVHTGSTLMISIRPDFRAFKGYDLAISSFMKRAESHGFRVQLTTGSAATSALGEAKGSRVAGVLILGKTIPEEEQESSRLAAASIPHVFINRVFHDNTTSWVSVDHRGAAREALEHLFSLGHTEIGTWGWTTAYRLDAEKRRGYLDAHAARGIEPPPSCLDYDTHGDLEEAVQALIDERRLPSAWFASSDEHALRFIKVARKNGLSVPGDVAIVGMDDAGQAEYMNPALTTVHIPFQAAGSAAFDVLKQLIENPDAASVRMVLKHRLVVRESCGAVGSESPRDAAQRLPVSEQTEQNHTKP